MPLTKSVPAKRCLVAWIGNKHVRCFSCRDVARWDFCLECEVLCWAMVPAVKAAQAVKAHEAAMDPVDAGLRAAI